MANGPWDSRVARLLIWPLRNTSVHPNHITTLGLLAGLWVGLLYATGRPTAMNTGAALFLVTAILDHADGELARLTGKTSAFGHAYDRIVDLVVKLSLFTGMGFGLRHGALGHWGTLMGVTAGVSLVLIFLLRGEIGKLKGSQALKQPSAAGFEIEDILYVIAPLTWLGWLTPFVVGAGIGAPVFAIWTYLEYRAATASSAPLNSSATSKS